MLGRAYANCIFENMNATNVTIRTGPQREQELARMPRKLDLVAHST